MSADSKFRTFMRAHLGEQSYNRLANKYKRLPQITLLILMATETALMWLCEDNVGEDTEQAIELLMFNGVNPHIISSREKTAYDWISDKSSLSVRSLQLLQGCIRMNNTKRALLTIKY